MNTTRPLAVFLAFANDRSGGARYLRNLPEEQRHVREAMEAAVEAGLCELVERSNATIDEVLDVFQDPEYRDRIAVFHFGGHAGGAELLMESAVGAPAVAHAGGLARFLGSQRGLQLVFLNGCSSRGQVQGLLDAGVPAVIATSEAIDDAVATHFSARFYRSLASGASIRTAYAEAQAAVQTRQGEQARGAYRSFVPEEVVEARWPWDLYVAPGAEDRVARWSLPLAARDPLFGLPPLPPMDLPAAPFKHLSWFGREDAHVFFGRGREIRDLYEAVTRPEAEPIVLLFGATGAGKSSLLAAGLAPRLEATHEVVYLRRDGALGLAGTLRKAFGESGDWRAREEATGKPLVVILDQAEEAWTRPLSGASGSKEADELAAALRSIFGVRERRPRGRLILSFRKEWLAEVLRLVDGEKLPRFRVEVTHLDRDAIAEAIAGPARSESLQRYYHLEVEPELPGIVADDLLEDSGAAIAPALQILLTKMWTLATKERPDAPRFTADLYRRLKREGILLDDFLGEQLESLRQWRPPLVESGLALDLLAHHTTALGTAETRKAAEVVSRYGGRPEIAELLRQCQDRYLLSCAGDDTRLAHDTLAPLVRRRFEISDLPGQRASRILQQRAVEWAGGKEGPPLDEVDLSVVEQGAGGLRAWTPDEQRLVERSRKERQGRKRQRRGLRWAAALAVLLFAAAGAFLWAERAQRQVEAEEAQAKAEEARIANQTSAFLGNVLVVDGIDLGREALARTLRRSRQRIAAELEDQPEVEERVSETIGVAFHNLGLLQEAEELYRRALALGVEELGPEHPSTLLAMTNLAMTVADQGRFEEAETLYRQALETRRRVFGEEHRDTLAAMSNLASVYNQQGRFKDAEDLYRKTLQINRRALGAEHAETLWSMNGLASALEAQGRFAEAEDLFRQTFEIRSRVLGENHRDTLASKDSIANVLTSQGHLREAESLHRQALDARLATLGPENTDTLWSKNNLAVVLDRQGRYREAEALYREILDIRLDVVGERNPDTILAMNNVAVVLYLQDRFEEAEALYDRALVSSESLLGAEHPYTLYLMANLADVYRGEGRLAEAERLGLQVLEIRKRVLSPEHPETLKSMNTLATVYREQGRLAEAERLVRQTVDIRLRVSGKEHPDTLIAMYTLATVMQALGRLDEAQARHQEVFEVRSRVLGPEHSDTRKSQRSLSEVGELRSRQQASR